MGDTIYARDGGKIMEIECPTRGPWFGKFIRGSKLRMGIIKDKDFGVISGMIQSLLEGWETEWRGEGLLLTLVIPATSA